MSRSKWHLLTPSSTWIFGLFILLLVAACGSGDLDPQDLAPECEGAACEEPEPEPEPPFSISFDQSEYEARFFEVGETDVILILSEIGEPDNVYVEDDAPASVSYDGATGKVRWTQGLPLGETTVTVTAVKDDREVSTQLTIVNQFIGANFAVGGYNFVDEDAPLTVTEFAFDLLENGQTEGYDDGDNTLPDSGSWSIDSNQPNHILFELSYMGDSKSYEGTIHHDEVSAYMEGTWSGGGNDGYFMINLESLPY